MFSSNPESSKDGAANSKRYINNNVEPNNTNRNYEYINRNPMPAYNYGTLPGLNQYGFPIAPSDHSMPECYFHFYKDNMFHTISTKNCLPQNLFQPNNDANGSGQEDKITKEQSLISLKRLEKQIEIPVETGEAGCEVDRLWRIREEGPPGEINKKKKPSVPQPQRVKTLEEQRLEAELAEKTRRELKIQREKKLEIERKQQKERINATLNSTRCGAICGLNQARFHPYKQMNDIRYPENDLVAQTLKRMVNRQRLEKEAEAQQQIQFQEEITKREEELRRREEKIPVDDSISPKTQESNPQIVFRHPNYQSGSQVQEQQQSNSHPRFQVGPIMQGQHRFDAQPSYPTGLDINDQRASHPSYIIQGQQPSNSQTHNYQPGVAYPIQNHPFYNSQESNYQSVPINQTRQELNNQQQSNFQHDLIMQQSHPLYNPHQSNYQGGPGVQNQQMLNPHFNYQPGFVFQGPQDETGQQANYQNSVMFPGQPFFNNQQANYHPGLAMQGHPLFNAAHPNYPTGLELNGQRLNYQPAYIIQEQQLFNSRIPNYHPGVSYPLQNHQFCNSQESNYQPVPINQRRQELNNQQQSNFQHDLMMQQSHPLYNSHQSNYQGGPGVQNQQMFNSQQLNYPPSHVTQAPQEVSGQQTNYPAGHDLRNELKNKGKQPDYKIDFKSKDNEVDKNQSDYQGGSGVEMKQKIKENQFDCLANSESAESTTIKGKELNNQTGSEKKTQKKNKGKQPMYQVDSKLEENQKVEQNNQNKLQIFNQQGSSTVHSNYQNDNLTRHEEQYNLRQSNYQSGSQMEGGQENNVKQPVSQIDSEFKAKKKIKNKHSNSKVDTEAQAKRKVEASNHYYQNVYDTRSQRKLKAKSVKFQIDSDTKEKQEKESNQNNCQNSLTTQNNLFNAQNSNSHPGAMIDIQQSNNSQHSNYQRNFLVRDKELYNPQDSNCQSGSQLECKQEIMSKQSDSQDEIKPEVKHKTEAGNYDHQTGYDTRSRRKPKTKPLKYQVDSGPIEQQKRETNNLDYQNSLMMQNKLFNAQNSNYQPNCLVESQYNEQQPNYQPGFQSKSNQESKSEQSDSQVDSGLSGETKNESSNGEHAYSESCQKKTIDKQPEYKIDSKLREKHEMKVGQLSYDNGLNLNQPTFRSQNPSFHQSNSKNSSDHQSNSENIEKKTNENNQSDHQDASKLKKAQEDEVNQLNYQNGMMPKQQSYNLQQLNYQNGLTQNQPVLNFQPPSNHQGFNLYHPNYQANSENSEKKESLSKQSDFQDTLKLKQAPRSETNQLNHQNEVIQNQQIYNSQNFNYQNRFMQNHPAFSYQNPNLHHSLFTQGQYGLYSYRPTHQASFEYRAKKKNIRKQLELQDASKVGQKQETDFTQLNFQNGVIQNQQNFDAQNSNYQPGFMMPGNYEVNGQKPIDQIGSELKVKQENEDNNCDPECNSGIESPQITKDEQDDNQDDSDLESQKADNQDDSDLESQQADNQDDSDLESQQADNQDDSDLESQQADNQDDSDLESKQADNQDDSDLESQQANNQDDSDLESQQADNQDDSDLESQQADNQDNSDSERQQAHELHSVYRIGFMMQHQLFHFPQFYNQSDFKMRQKQNLDFKTRNQYDFKGEKPGNTLCALLEARQQILETREVQQGKRAKDETVLKSSSLYHINEEKRDYDNISMSTIEDILDCIQRERENLNQIEHSNNNYTGSELDNLEQERIKQSQINDIKIKIESLIYLDYNKTGALSLALKILNQNQINTNPSEHNICCKSDRLKKYNKSDKLDMSEKADKDDEVNKMNKDDDDDDNDDESSDDDKGNKDNEGDGYGRYESDKENEGDGHESYESNEENENDSDESYGGNEGSEGDGGNEGNEGNENNEDNENNESNEDDENEKDDNEKNKVDEADDYESDESDESDELLEQIVVNETSSNSNDKFQISYLHDNDYVKVNSKFCDNNLSNSYSNKNLTNLGYNNTSCSDSNLSLNNKSFSKFLSDDENNSESDEENESDECIPFTKIDSTNKEINGLIIPPVRHIAENITNSCNALIKIEGHVPKRLASENIGNHVSKKFAFGDIDQQITGRIPKNADNIVCENEYKEIKYNEEYEDELYTTLDMKTNKDDLLNTNLKETEICNLRTFQGEYVSKAEDNIHLEYNHINMVGSQRSCNEIVSKSKIQSVFLEVLDENDFLHDRSSRFDFNTFNRGRSASESFHRDTSVSSVLDRMEVDDKLSDNSDSIKSNLNINDSDIVCLDSDGEENFFYNNNLRSFYLGRNDLEDFLFSCDSDLEGFSDAGDILEFHSDNDDCYSDNESVNIIEDQDPDKSFSFGEEKRKIDLDNQTLSRTWYLTSYKVVLLFLIKILSVTTLPNIYRVPLLRFLAKSISAEEVDCVPPTIEWFSILKLFKIEYLHSSLSDLLLKKIWEVDTYELFISRIEESVRYLSSITIFEQDLKVGSFVILKNSIIGSFVQKCIFFFKYDDFFKNSCLWVAFCSFRQETHLDYSISNEGSPTDTPVGICFKKLNEFLQTNNYEIFLPLIDCEENLDRSSISYRRPLWIRNLGYFKKMESLGKEICFPNTMDYYDFMVEFDNSNREASINSLHSFFDSLFTNKGDFHYQYSLLYLAALNGIFGHHTEAAFALGESLSLSRQINDTDALKYALDWKNKKVIELLVKTNGDTYSLTKSASNNAIIKSILKNYKPSLDSEFFTTCYLFAQKSLLSLKLSLSNKTLTYASYSTYHKFFEEYTSTSVSFYDSLGLVCVGNAIRDNFISNGKNISDKYSLAKEVCHLAIIEFHTDIDLGLNRLLTYKTDSPITTNYVRAHIYLLKSIECINMGKLNMAEYYFRKQEIIHCDDDFYSMSLSTAKIKYHIAIGNYMNAISIIEKQLEMYDNSVYNFELNLIKADIMLKLNERYKVISLLSHLYTVSTTSLMEQNIHKCLYYFAVFANHENDYNTSNFLLNHCIPVFIRYDLTEFLSLSSCLMGDNLYEILITEQRFTDKFYLKECLSNYFTSLSGFSKLGMREKVFGIYDKINAISEKFSYRVFEDIYSCVDSIREKDNSLNMLRKDFLLA